MRTTAITKDTTVCISLAGTPSSIGTRFHNYLYDELGLDFVYKAFTTTDLRAAVGGIRALGIRGCGVSMPFKEDVIELVDELDASARAIGAVNTLVNTDGRLTAYNTDVLAVTGLLRRTGVRPVEPAVVGSGGMARACVAAMAELGFPPGTVVSRNERTGRVVARRHGWAWRGELGEHRPDLVANTTPVGMAGGPAPDDSPVREEVVAHARVVLDAVAVPSETALIARARAGGAVVVTGAEVMALQAAEQFALYTGVRPTADQVVRAAAFSRGQA
jgi:shikimate dehydrogenase